jgi:hypothetical protein
LRFASAPPSVEVLDVNSELSHWLEQDDIARYQGGIKMIHQRQRKRQRREETEMRARDFKAFYAAYPKKKSAGHC